VKASVNIAAADWKIGTFRNTWASLLQQTYSPLEVSLVIVERNGAVREWLDKQDRPPFEIKVQVCECPSLHGRATHNQMALDIQEGDVYLGAQDDMVYPPEWVESHIPWHTSSNGPWLVFNPFVSELSDGSLGFDHAWWNRRMDPVQTPVVLRWQYMSGHGLSVPMDKARLVGHESAFDGKYGYEDLHFSYLLFDAGCKCVFDVKVKPMHQYHGYPWEKPWDEYIDWIRQKTANKHLFEELNGVTPEYGHI